MLNEIKLEHYLPYINSLPESNIITPDDVLNSNFLLEKDNNIEMYYAPHNEYINRDAKVVIVGITPGWTQMKAALLQAKICLHEGASTHQILEQSKRAAGFAGTMRENLIEMLDECEMNKAFGLSSTRQLFEKHFSLLHTTSVIKYPVFVKKKNYTGHTPKIGRSRLLTEYAYHIFLQELKEIKQDYLLFPLGKAVTEVISDLAKQGEIPMERCLFGFPHPSGANGHRKKQFMQNKQQLQTIVKKFSQHI